MAGSPGKLQDEKQAFILSLAFFNLHLSPPEYVGTGCPDGESRNNRDKIGRPTAFRWQRSKECVPIQPEFREQIEVLKIFDIRFRKSYCPDGEIGRRTAFRWQRSKECAGSNPVLGTKAEQCSAFFIPQFFEAIMRM